MKTTKMDKIVELIHTLDSDSVSSETKLEDIKFCRDNGVITNDEAIDLVTAYDIRKGGKMGSKARANGNCDYRLWTTEELIEGYAFENGRINEKDKLIAQRLIKKELIRRFNATIKFLDDEQTTDNPHGTYRYLTGK